MLFLKSDLMNPICEAGANIVTTLGIKPEDILSDNETFADINGLSVRKGSIAAFLKNIDLLEHPESLEPHKMEAIVMLKQLAPAVIATGLYGHATFKNNVVQKLLEEAFIEMHNNI